MVREQRDGGTTAAAYVPVMQVRNSVCMRRVESCCPSDRLPQMASISSMKMTVAPIPSQPPPSQIVFALTTITLVRGEGEQHTGRLLFHRHHEQLAHQPVHRGWHQLETVLAVAATRRMWRVLLALAKVLRDQVGRGDGEEGGVAHGGDDLGQVALPRTGRAVQKNPLPRLPLPCHANRECPPPQTSSASAGRKKSLAGGASTDEHLGELLGQEDGLFKGLARLVQPGHVVPREVGLLEQQRVCVATVITTIA